jgi:AraC family transcriptional regulator of adaptative response / methylphosphotriester-DNA alkyltransferase methyltransferase
VEKAPEELRMTTRWLIKIKDLHPINTIPQISSITLNMETLAAKIPKKIFARQHEITADYLKAIDKHLDDILSGAAIDMFEIRDFAELLHIHPTHLSNTIKLTTGKAPCYFIEHRILDIVRDQLVNTNMPIAEIARNLTYDPSNFTKFFKHFEGMTPNQYRQSHQNTETVTI